MIGPLPLAPAGGSGPGMAWRKPMKTEQIDILSRAVAPGCSVPAYKPTMDRVSTIQARGSNTRLAKALAIMANRVCDAVRVEAEELLKTGSVSYEHAGRIVSAVEHAAGATTHCTPGYGPCESSGMDSGGFGALSERLGVHLINTREIVAATALGVASTIANDTYTAWAWEQGRMGGLDASVKEKLTGEEKAKLRRMRDMLNAMVEGGAL